MKTSKSSDSRKPVRATAKAPRARGPLVSSPAQAKRESAGLRRGRKELESSPTTADTDIRSSLI